MIDLVPLNRDEAFAFVAQHHRHHLAPVGYKFAIGAARRGEVIGVAIVGRPVARALDGGYTAEVTRLCVLPDPHPLESGRNACSLLYGACWRAARAMGYRRLVTYLLADEGGGSLRAAGWHVVAETAGGSWSCESRPRVDKHPLQAKLRYEVTE